MNHLAPRVHATCRSLTRKLATIIRTRFGIHASARSWRMPASTSGYPVRPCDQASNRSSASLPVSTRMPVMCGCSDRHVDSGACHRMSA
jgi:hypothetical protein